MYNKNSMIFWENTNTKAALNLAIEATLLDSEYTKNHPVFMLWQNASSVIIGRHQNAFEEIDMNFLEKNNIALVRRGTGGGAVYHDLGNLNFSFIIPTDSPKVDFHIFLKPMIEALNSIGIPAEVSGRNDILVNGKKVCGTAQAKGKHAILVHGSMLIGVDLDTLEYVLTGNPDKYESKGIASVRSRVLNMQDVLLENGSIKNKEEALSCIKNTLRDYFVPQFKEGTNNLPKEIIDEILLNAEQFAKERYANSTWTLNQSPPFTASLRKKLPFGSIRVNYNVKKGKITACKIEGDFFALKDISCIEESLVGIDYNSKQIIDTLEKFNFQEFILNADNEKVLALFSEC